MSLYSTRPSPPDEHYGLPINLIIKVEHNSTIVLNQNRYYNVKEYGHHQTKRPRKDHNVNGKERSSDDDLIVEGGFIYLHEQDGYSDYTFGRDTNNRAYKDSLMDVVLPGTNHGFKNMPRKAFRLVPDKAKNLFILQALSNIKIKVNEFELYAAKNGGNRSSIYIDPENVNKVKVDGLTLEIWQIREAAACGDKVESFPDMALDDMFKTKAGIYSTIATPTIMNDKEEVNSRTEVGEHNENGLQHLYVLKEHPVATRSYKVINPLTGDKYVGTFFDTSKGDDKQADLERRISESVTGDPSIIKYLPLEARYGRCRILLSDCREEYIPLREYLKKIDFYRWRKEDRCSAAASLFKELASSLETLHERRVLYGNINASTIHVAHLTTSTARILLRDLSKASIIQPGDHRFLDLSRKEAMWGLRLIRSVMLFTEMTNVAKSMIDLGIVTSYEQESCSMGPVFRVPSESPSTAPDSQSNRTYERKSVTPSSNMTAEEALQRALEGYEQAKAAWVDYRGNPGYESLGYRDTLLGMEAFDADQRVNRLRKAVNQEAKRLADLQLKLPRGWTREKGTDGLVLSRHAMSKTSYSTHPVRKITQPEESKVPSQGIPMHEPALNSGKRKSQAGEKGVYRSIDEEENSSTQMILENSIAYYQFLSGIEEMFTLGHPFLDDLLARLSSHPDSWNITIIAICKEIRTIKGDFYCPFRALLVPKDFRLGVKKMASGQDVLFDLTDLRRFLRYVQKTWPAWASIVAAIFKAYGRDDPGIAGFCAGRHVRAFANDLANKENLPPKMAELFKILRDKNSPSIDALVIKSGLNLWYHVPSRSFNITNLLSLADPAIRARVSKDPSLHITEFQELLGEDEIEGIYVSLDLLKKYSRALQVHVVGTPVEATRRAVDAADFSGVDSKKYQILAKRSSLQWATLDRKKVKVEYPGYSHGKDNLTYFRGTHGDLQKLRLLYFFGPEYEVPTDRGRPKSWYSFRKQVPMPKSEEFMASSMAGSVCDDAYSMDLNNYAGPSSNESARNTDADQLENSRLKTFVDDTPKASQDGIEKVPSIQEEPDQSSQETDYGPMPHFDVENVLPRSHHVEHTRPSLLPDADMVREEKTRDPDLAAVVPKPSEDTNSDTQKDLGHESQEIEASDFSSFFSDVGNDSTPVSEELHLFRHDHAAGNDFHSMTASPTAYDVAIPGTDPESVPVGEESDDSGPVCEGR
ncbi:hypothetical protein BU16DRAFT_566202 [Lophium mytilinum]|uniref:Protein kinase domain-containing protein n=1 Tax=Lophium mytilinum TaxID=390894 RepID=A0A6A6QCQ2_9PEZI|nr:hypothetical protein BU16DRAFT_566202 [Lophium mytilinum]